MESWDETALGGLGEAAAVDIQRVYRGHKVRHTGTASTPPAGLDASAANPVQEEAAATTVQRHLRGHLARKDVARQQHAAVSVQKHMRGHLARQELQQRHDAATAVQAQVRGHRERRDVAARHNAAVVIQSHTRGRIVRSRVAHGHVDTTAAASDAATGTVTAADAATAATTLGIVEGAASSDLDFTITEQHHDAALVIQRHIRGSLGRSRVHHLRAAERALQDSVPRDNDGLVAVDGFLGLSSPSQLPAVDGPAGLFVDLADSPIAAAAEAELIDDLATFSSPASRASVAAAAIDRAERELGDIQEAGTETDMEMTMVDGGTEAGDGNGDDGDAPVQAIDATVACAEGPDGAERVDNLSELEAVHHGAAVTLQRTFRGYSSRRQLLHRHDSARHIQRVFRGHTARQDMRRRTRGAREVQRVYRGHRVRLMRANVKSSSGSGFEAPDGVPAVNAAPESGESDINGESGAPRRSSAYARDAIQATDSKDVQNELQGLSGDLLRLVRRMVDDKVRPCNQTCALCCC